jgi:ketosteroid isomerase-like protein
LLADHDRLELDPVRTKELLGQAADRSAGVGVEDDRALVHCDVGEPILARVPTSPLDAYFAALDAGNDDAATAAFTEDAVYIRPAIGDPRVLDVIRGRERIREALAARRERRKVGEYAHRHEIRATSSDGPRCFVEALMVTDGGPSGVFLATFDDDGLIKRYLAVYAETPAGFDG